MIEIISSDQYSQILWKNGKGSTTQLAINEGADLNSFEWRLSIAKVDKDGPFSNFDGYFRNLVLIEGGGITLKHNQASTDHLDAMLKVASFAGDNQTIGTLHEGPIVDFNVITKASIYHTIVKTYDSANSVAIEQSTHCFIYSLSSTVKLINKSGLQRVLPTGHLLKISDEDMSDFVIAGESLIVVSLQRID